MIILFSGLYWLSNIDGTSADDDVTLRKVLYNAITSWSWFDNIWCAWGVRRA